MCSFYLLSTSPLFLLRRPCFTIPVGPLLSTSSPHYPCNMDDRCFTQSQWPSDHSAKSSSHLTEMLAIFSPLPHAPLPSPPPDSRFSALPISSPSLDTSDPDDLMHQFRKLNKSQRFAFLSSLVGELRLPEALVVSRRIEPRLRRDFLRELPLELALHCLSFVSLLSL